MHAAKEEIRMSTFFGEPYNEYSPDGGKTWRRDGPFIAPGMLMRVVAEDGTVLFRAHAEHTEQKCDCCDGTGTRKIYRYVRDAQ